MRAVWFIMTECRARAASDFPGPPGASIWVECYVPAGRIHEALEMAENALEEAGYNLTDVDRCLRFDLDDWDERRYPRGSRTWQTVQRVLRRGAVEFGPFVYQGESDG